MNIGITQRVDKIATHDEFRDALDQRLIDWVLEAGFLPVPIPNTLVDFDLSTDNQKIINNWVFNLGIDALLLSGGNDLGETPQRDLTETCLLSWAEENGTPVLGICRGMQMMAKYFGAKLINVDGHVGSVHLLKEVSGGEKIFSNSVNSYHNQALQQCPDMFKILAKAEDGVIEAMTHKKLPWEAWMWHPERESIFIKKDQERFKKLVNSGK